MSQQSSFVDFGNRPPSEQASRIVFMMLERNYILAGLRRNGLNCLLFALSSCLSTYGLLAQGSSPQQRQIKIVPLNLHAPIQVPAVLNRGNILVVPKGANQVVTIQEGGSDWLGNIAFTVENHSSKSITAVEARVAVDDWQEDRRYPKRAILFHEGQLPTHTLNNPQGGSFPEESSSRLDVKPGTSVNIPLVQALVKLQLSFPSESVPLASVQGITIQVDRIVFADGTMWAHNAYLKPDESTPASYVQISLEEWESYKSQPAFYQNGTGGTQSYTRAYAWYKQAALNGYPPSEAALGNLYNLGLGVGPGQLTAYAWTSLAASKGNKDAQARLALMGSAISTEDKAAAAQEVARVIAKNSVTN